jgi:N-acyl homoserine lactone hydrolase
MQLYVLDMGFLDVATVADLLPLTHPSGRQKVPVTAYLVIGDDQRKLLVDTGMPARLAGPAETALTRSPFGASTVPVLCKGQTVAGQLNRLGLRPSDIHDVVCTHVDWDHCGGNALFAGTNFWIQEDHFQAAVDDRAGRYPEADWRTPGIEWCLVRGRVEVWPGLELIPTPGHAPGHQSVLVNLRRRPVLICGDAIASREKMVAGHWLDQEDPEAAAASASLLESQARRHHARLLFGHDPSQSSRVRRSPRFYD